MFILAESILFCFPSSFCGLERAIRSNTVVTSSRSDCGSRLARPSRTLFLSAFEIWLMTLVRHAPSSTALAAAHFAGQISDARPCAKAVRLTIVAQHEGTPGGGAKQVQQDADGCGLAGPVQAQESECFAGGDLQVEVMDGLQITVTLGESLDGDRAVGGHKLLV